MDSAPSPTPTPTPLPPSTPQVVEESSVSPTVQAAGEVARTFPYKSLALVLAIGLPIFLGVSMVTGIVQNVHKQEVHQQALLNQAASEDLISSGNVKTQGGTANESDYTNPLDETTQYQNPFTVSAYSNPFDQ